MGPKSGTFSLNARRARLFYAKDHSKLPCTYHNLEITVSSPLAEAEFLASTCVACEQDAFEKGRPQRANGSLGLVRIADCGSAHAGTPFENALLALQRGGLDHGRRGDVTQRDAGLAQGRTITCCVSLKVIGWP